MIFSKKGVILFLITLFILFLAIFLDKFNLKVISITEKEKCPACFGISLCEEINDNKIYFEYKHFHSFFNNLLSIKNVYYGKYKNINVIMKKLAHRAELDDFDEMVCNNPELHELCFEKPTINKARNFYELIKSELGNTNMTDVNIKIRLCPSIIKMNELLKNIMTQDLSEDDYKYLFTTIKINPEPIILQILPNDDNWPVPKYFGACGRLIIEEYTGSPLSVYYEESWIKRAKIASSLLDAAYKFTFKNPNFAFYLTDISMDNIAVNKDDKAIFVDLENIIIVDKHPPEKFLKTIPTWNKTYGNEIDYDCEDCFVFSPTDICKHKISDHNYYAVCQQILVQRLDTNEHIEGLLHDPPEEILNNHSNLMHLLKQCLKPDKPHSRIDIGIQLKKLLDIISTYKK